MLVLLIAGLTALLLSPASTTGPVKFGTMTITFTPVSSCVITEGESQIYRAPLCKGQLFDQWSFKAKVYMMNVPWDADEVGDNNWLHMKVSNRPDMTNIVRDNARDATPGLGPQPFTRPFTYNRATWGPDDIYIQITASEGTPTFQYGLELSASLPRDDLNIPDGMNSMETVPENHALTRDCVIQTLEQVAKRDCVIQTLEQVAIPFTDNLTSGDTGQYKIPFCFEDTYDQRSLTITTRVREAVNEAPGGVASFICTSSMLKNGLCWRSMATERGTRFFDPSGAKVISDTPTIPRAEYGPIYILVLVQGNYRDTVEFTITTKLRNPATDNLKLTGHSKKDLHSILTYLKSTYESKSPPFNPDFVPHELKEEL